MTVCANRQAAFYAAITAYEDALSDYRRIRTRAEDGKAAPRAVEEAREEVTSARAKFNAAARALAS